MTGKDRAEGGEYVETTSTQAVLTVMRDTDAPIVTVGDVAWVPDEDKTAESSRRHGDDYYGENPDWADDLPDLGESA
ncbi:hypothetical protein BRD12_07940 [Halobacteriales archaeon SW_12_67_38]|nr:MAG: hypothetical protein BRD12_07940 [Halobacteriales archaeon SW_12_67_38]